MKVRLSPYNPEWINEYKKECKRLKELFGELVIQFEHFGSTSIVNMKAKSVIDMMVIVKNIDKVDQFNSQLRKLGYDIAGEWGIEGRRLLRKGGEDRTHHIHIYQEGNREIDRHLIFRDYLRIHKDEAIKYSTYKEQLAMKYHDTKEYSKAKRSYVSELEQKALEWHKKEKEYE
ncbi:GrpB family protein [Oceanobacillus neutriphilus]|uniref:GrpB family protein n=1 Tax=Oceanobacillus neutriphilus TaxID=531815 RepID=UPI0016640F21|nr:GrpB family protein [Oceanobacillus neutriphilus]